MTLRKAEIMRLGQEKEFGTHQTKQKDSSFFQAPEVSEIKIRCLSHHHLKQINQSKIQQVILYHI